MDKCFACHKESGDGKFCGYCGQPQVCDGCGERFTSEGAFCMNCGTKRLSNSKTESHSQIDPVASHAQVSNSGNGSQTQQSDTANISGNPVKQFIEKIGKRNTYIIGGILIALVIFLIFQSSNDNPDKVVENFIAAMNDGNLEKMEKYIEPTVWYEDISNEMFEMTQMMKMYDVSFELIDLQVDYAGEDYIVYDAVINTSFIEGDFEESSRENVEIELVRVDKKWYIVELY